jgi:glucokinase
VKSKGSYGIGIDLGGTTFAVGVFDAEGGLVDRSSHDTPVTSSADVVADSVAQAARERMALPQVAEGSVVGLAIGFPGPVDPEAGIVKKAPNIQCLAGYPLTKALSERLGGLKVSLQNDAYCATLAELRWGAGKGSRNLLMLTLGTGIGGGIAIDGKVVRGPRQIMGEIGHMILDPAGRKCGCGNYGCFEAMAARDAIVEWAAREIQTGRPTQLLDLVEGDQRRLTPEIVSNAALAGDAAAQEVYQRVGFYIGIGICNCIVMCDPDVVVLGGGIAAAGDVLFEPVRRTVKARGLISGFDVSKIVPAQYGNLAGIYGAGALAWEQA